MVSNDSWPLLDIHTSMCPHIWLTAFQHWDPDKVPFLYMCSWAAYFFPLICLIFSSSSKHRLPLSTQSLVWKQNTAAYSKHGCCSMYVYARLRQMLITKPASTATGTDVHVFMNTSICLCTAILKLLFLYLVQKSLKRLYTVYNL